MFTGIFTVLVLVCVVSKNTYVVMALDFVFVLPRAVVAINSCIY